MDYISTIWQCFVVLVLLKSAHSYSLPQNSLNDIANRTQCVSLCSECGCLGYFCGEECICECISDSDKDINCLTKLKARSDSLNLPYDLLIQGSAGRRFVREVRDLTPKQEEFYHANERRGRSVYNIHSPNPWKSGKDEPVAFEDSLLGAPGFGGGDLGSLVSKIKTDTALLGIKQKLLSPLPALSPRNTILGDVKNDLRDGYEKLKDGVKAIPWKLDDISDLKLKSLFPRRESTFKEKLDIIDIVPDSLDDSVGETLLKMKLGALRLGSRDRLVNLIRNL